MNIDIKERKMREILFRGKRLNGDGWAYGDLSYHVHDGEVYVFPGDGYDSPDCYEVDPATVGQYTGLTDSNNVKIFEGDIVLVNDSTELPYLFEVKFGNCGGVKNVEHKVGYVGFYFSVITDSGWIKSSLRTDPIYFLSNLGCEVKVIGNVFENPELLNET